MKKTYLGPRVSIVVPVYNMEPYLSDCVSSLKMQTYKNIEIILVDDGSCEECALLCDRLALDDDRVRVIHKKNGGLVSARKAGLEIATGEYLFNLDGDDWIEVNTIEKMVDIIEKDNSDIVQCGYVIYGGERDGLVWSSCDCCFEINEHTINDVLSDFLVTHQNLNTLISTKLYRTDIFRKAYHNVPDLVQRADDIIAFIEALMICHKISSIQDVMMHYRMRSDSKSNSRGGVTQIINLDFTIDHVYRMVTETALFYNFPITTLSNWVMKFKLDQLMAEYASRGVSISVYKYGNPKLLYGRKIVLYGAGTVGNDYYSQLALYTKIEIVAWMDSNPEKYCYEYCNVEAPDIINSIEFDMILIAVKSEKTANVIRNMLLTDYRIPNSLIIWEKPKNGLEEPIESDI